MLNDDRIHVLILTDDDTEVSIRRAVELGIGGYLPLSSGVESVVHAVRCIHKGGTAIAHRLERSVDTAKSHVRAILMKLGASSRVEAVTIARRRGLVSEKSRRSIDSLH
jgi:DNA-binding NarL/FixJ family response regulator